jgi:glycosyltransferase involved in cell wall biosynthesis
MALADNHQLRLHMGTGGRKRIEQAFSFTQRLRRVEELYDRILRVKADRFSPFL